MTTISTEVVCNIIRRLLNNQNYRPEIVNLIDAIFLDQSINFLQQVATAKSTNPNNPNWYKENMLNDSLEIDDIAWNAGIGKKTIGNIHGSQSKPIVFRVANEHYDTITNLINTTERNVEVNLSITVNDEQINFTSEESLKIINALAARKAGIRGGAWSTAGKKVEKPLLITLCRLLQVPETCYNQNQMPEHIREIDFHLSNGNENFRTEVKLMGRGNPESADTLDWRGSQVFVADRLSNLNKRQLTNNNVQWVAMDDGDTLGQFSGVLTNLEIPNIPFNSNLNEELNEIFLEVDF